MSAGPQAQSAVPREGLIFKVLGLLVTYPEQELLDALEEFSSVIANSRLSAPTQKGLTALLVTLGSSSLLDAQEGYVRLFDRSTRLSLYLYEHVHGESRDRGQAMVDLRAHYQRFGLVPPDNELPDYVPVFCEFVSVMDEVEANGLLAEVAPLFGLLDSRLTTRNSPYAAVFTALGELSGAQLDASEIEDADEGPDLATESSFEALDKVWEESEVTFGEGAAHDSCEPSRRPPGDTLVKLRVNSSSNRRSNSGSSSGQGAN